MFKKLLFLFALITLIGCSSDSSSNESLDYADITEYLLDNSFTFDTTIGGSSNIPVKYYFDFLLDDNFASYSVQEWYDYQGEFETKCVQRGFWSAGGLMITQEDKRIIWQTGDVQNEVSINSLSKTNQGGYLKLFVGGNLRETYLLTKIGKEERDAYLESVSDLCECKDVPTICVPDGFDEQWTLCLRNYYYFIPFRSPY